MQDDLGVWPTPIKNRDEPGGLDDAEDRDTGAVQNRVAPAVDMPGQVRRADAIGIRPDAQVGVAAQVERVESDEDVRVLPERQAGKVDLLLVIELGLVPRANILGVGGRAKHVFPILWVSDPPSGGRVEDGIAPGVDVEGKAGRVDVRDSGLHAVITIVLQVELVEERDDLGRRDEGAGEVDATGSESLGLVPRVVLGGRELAPLVLQVSGSHVEPGCAARVERSVGPAIDVHNEAILGDIAGVRLGTDVGIVVDVEAVKSDGQTRRSNEGLGEGDFFGSLLCRLVPKPHVLGVKESSSRHVVLGESRDAECSL